LTHEDVRSSSDSYISQSIGFPVQPVPPPAVFAVPPVSAVVSVPPVAAVPASTPPPPALLPSLSTRPEPFKLVEIKDAKAYINNYDLIQYYLRIPEFSYGCSDGVLQMDTSNAESSRVWECQICLAVKDGSHHFLFENKGDLFHGRGFEMLATLNQHCHLDTVSNVFFSLLSLFNEVQGDSKPILEY
jgi:hypothetical protein